MYVLHFVLYLYEVPLSPS